MSSTWLNLHCFLQAVLRAIKAAFEYGLPPEDAPPGSSEGTYVNDAESDSASTCCEKPLAGICGVCCCVSSFCCCAAPAARVNSKDKSTIRGSIHATEEYNEQVRWWFESALYCVGIPLLLLSFGFIIYAPICKPGIENLAAFNLTIPNSK